MTHPPLTTEKKIEKLKGTSTEKNLMLAFSGESQARNRYDYFSKKARSEGYIQIAKIFEETAKQEKEHAKRFFKFMSGGEVEISNAFPFGVIGTTLENLLSASSGENYEHTTMYPNFAKKAREEGFNEIAVVFEHIAIAEKGHEKRFLALAKNIKEEKVFRKDSPVSWRCQNCGYIHEGTNALGLCPSCAHPQSHFELYVENW